MSSEAKFDGYVYADSACGHMHGLLIPALLEELAAIPGTGGKGARVFDLGCGNGSVAEAVAKAGFEVSGCDPSLSGIEAARQSRPHLNLFEGSAYEDLQARFGSFPLIYSLEVIEHVYDPRLVMKRAYEMLEPGGRLILSTPYHGYLKNLMLAVTGKMDTHFTALWDHGHIKFWSIKTLSILLHEAGFKIHKIHRLGRIPALAMTMMFVAEKPRA